jgi:hypothetical protein
MGWSLGGDIAVVPRALAQLRLHGSARAEKDADLSSFRSYSRPSRFSKVSES